MKNTKKKTKHLTEEMKSILDDSETKTPKGWVRFHVLHKCPSCRGELWEVGYFDMLRGQRYKCADRECGWGW